MFVISVFSHADVFQVIRSFDVCHKVFFRSNVYLSGVLLFGCLLFQCFCHSDVCQNDL